jgi:hypothetical protein
MGPCHVQEGPHTGSDVEQPLPSDSVLHQAQPLGPHLRPAGIVGDPSVVEVRLGVGGGDFALRRPRVNEAVATGAALNDVGIQIDGIEVSFATDVADRD